MSAVSAADIAFVTLFVSAFSLFALTSGCRFRLAKQFQRRNANQRGGEDARH